MWGHFWGKDVFAAASKIKTTKHITLDQANDQFIKACIMTARISQIKVQNTFKNLLKGINFLLNY